MNILRQSLPALVLVLLTGCGGMADMAYNHAPRFIGSKIDSAFNLSTHQSEQLNSRLQQFFIWHRQQELQRYQLLLETAALAATDGIDAEEFLAIRGEISLAWTRSLTKAIGDLGDLALSLSPKQIEHFERYHRNESADHQDYMKKSDQQREVSRVNHAFDRLENWYGEFDILVEERVRERLRQLPDLDLARYDYRQQRQQALIATLQNMPSRGFDHQKLKRTLMDPTTEHARRFEPVREAYWQAFAAALEEIDSWVTETQRQHVVTKLRKYARLAERLRDQG